MANQRFFFIVFLTASLNVCFLPPTWGYHGTTRILGAENSQFLPQNKPIYNDTSQTEERSISHGNIENKKIEDKATIADRVDVSSPPSGNLRTQRTQSSIETYVPVAPNNVPSSDKGTYEPDVFEESKLSSFDKEETEDGSSFVDQDAADISEEPRLIGEERKESRIDTDYEANNEIGMKPSFTTAKVAEEGLNHISPGGTGHRGVDLPNHTGHLDFPTASNRPHEYRQRESKDDDVMPDTRDIPQFRGDSLDHHVVKSAPDSDPVMAHRDTRTPRYTVMAHEEEGRIADPRGLFGNYNDRFPNSMETPDKKQREYRDNRGMQQSDSSSRDSEDPQRSVNENYGRPPYKKHPGTLELPADAEVSMRGAGWTAFDVPMGQNAGDQFQFSPLQDRDTSDSLNSEYRKYFGEFDDTIAFELPELHVNCWLQSMMATTWGFSPSCNANGSYGPKQCHEKRCWCVDSNGQKIRHHGGKDDDGFYFGLQGLTLYCAEN